MIIDLVIVKGEIIFEVVEELAFLIESVRPRSLLGIMVVVVVVVYSSCSRTILCFIRLEKD